jgi:hypothetical protein
MVVIVRACSCFRKRSAFDQVSAATASADVRARPKHAGAIAGSLDATDGGSRDAGDADEREQAVVSGVATVADIELASARPGEVGPVFSADDSTIAGTLTPPPIRSPMEI